MRLTSTGKSLLGASLPELKDCMREQERARGNVPLAWLDAQPKDMAQEQWCAFAGLHAYPCSQIRSLSVALEQDTLVLDKPEVCSVAFEAPVSELAVCIHLFFPPNKIPVNKTGGMLS